MMNRVMRDLENRVDLSDEPVSLQLGGIVVQDQLEEEDRGV